MTVEIDKWESGALGLDERYVAVDPENETNQKLVDKALDLLTVSIRLEESLITSLKLLAEVRDIEYTTLIRLIIKDYATKNTSTYKNE